MAKTITTKRIRLDPTQARTLKAMGGLVVANKPPPASQHRAVLLLRTDVPLFDMQDNSSANARHYCLFKQLKANDDGGDHFNEPCLGSRRSSVRGIDG